jgi:hypothetical protein
MAELRRSGIVVPNDSGTVIIHDSRISGKSSMISECMQQPPSFSHAFFPILSFIVSDNAVMIRNSGAIREQ